MLIRGALGLFSSSKLNLSISSAGIAAASGRVCGSGSAACGRSCGTGSVTEGGPSEPKILT